MANFFGSLFSKQPEEIKLPTASGDVILSRREANLYEQLFKAVDYDDDGQVKGAEGSIFLRRSQLSNQDLQRVWQLACGGASKPSLTSREFMLACRLVSCVQAEHECSLAKLVEKQSELIDADFGWGADSDTSPGPFPDISEREMGAGVDSWRFVQGGLSRHVVYKVRFSTQLKHYPVQSRECERRYSDFLWLHERLCKTFPSAILPLFPEKKRVGNTDPTFVEQRREQLHHYLATIVRHPRVGHSVDLSMFLTCSPQGLTAAKEYTRLVEAEAEESDGLLGRMMHGGGVQPLAIPPDDKFRQLAAFHHASLERLSQTSQVNKAVQSASISHAQTMTHISTIIHSLGDHEARYASAGVGLDAARRADEKAASAIKSATHTAASASGGPAAAAGEAGKATSVEEQWKQTAMISRDDQAREAFLAHASRASQAALVEDEIDGMFADADDPLADQAAPAAPEADLDATVQEPSSGPAAAREVVAAGPANSLPELGVLFAAKLRAVGAREREDTDVLSRTLFELLQLEQRREAELNSATARRKSATDALQGAHALLQRRRKAYAQLTARGNVQDDRGKQALAASKRAEKSFEARQREFDFITLTLKREMKRVMSVRRAKVARRAAEFCKFKATQATARQRVWERAARVVTADEAQLHGAKVRVENYYLPQNPAAARAIAGVALSMTPPGVLAGERRTLAQVEAAFQGGAGAAAGAGN